MLFRSDGGADALIRRADVALYKAKAEGRGRAHIFEPGMDAQSQARALLEADLRRAVAGDEIVPHFQPLVELGTGRLIGFEMLARWSHPTRGMVSPAEFVPVAEEIEPEFVPEAREVRGAEPTADSVFGTKE